MTQATVNIYEHNFDTRVLILMDCEKCGEDIEESALIPREIDYESYDNEIYIRCSNCKQIYVLPAYYQVEAELLSKDEKEEFEDYFDKSFEEYFSLKDENDE